MVVDREPRPMLALCEALPLLGCPHRNRFPLRHPPLTRGRASLVRFCPTFRNRKGCHGRGPFRPGPTVSTRTRSVASSPDGAAFSTRWSAPELRRRAGFRPAAARAAALRQDRAMRFQARKCIPPSRRRRPRAAPDGQLSVGDLDVERRQAPAMQMLDEIGRAEQDGIAELLHVTQTPGCRNSLVAYHVRLGRAAFAW